MELAKFEIFLPTDLVRRLEKIGSRGDEISRKMLESGARILKDKIDKNLKNNLYTNRGLNDDFPTGALEKSITTDKPKKDKNGNHYIRIYFKGNDSRGVPNAIKAVVMESGSSKQQKKPFIRPAVSEADKEVNAEMQNVFDQEVTKI